MENITICPSCHGTTLVKLFECKDNFLSQETFSLIKCDACKLVITNPQPSTDEISKYYKSEKYISHKAQSHTAFDIIYNSARFLSVKHKVNLINKLQLARSILDYGCGTGSFLEGCANANWNISGVEPNEQAREIASRKLKKELKSDLSQINKNDKVSVITLWHVLEHIHDLNENITLFHTLLHDKGKLIIAVPNHESFDAQIYKQYWAAYDVPRHLFHFSRVSLEFLLKKNNFCIDSVLPMKLDSFYISLLSEKYKTGRNNMTKSFLTGCKSNFYGRKTGNYSSLIYIASKC